MDIVSFIVFTFNARFVKRWLSAGIIFLIPFVNFLSLGYLARASGLYMIGDLGLPTWERRKELWWEGARLAYIVVLYEAVPSFLFSFAFLLSSPPGNFVTGFISGIVKLLAVLAFVVCSFFIPFAFCAFVEGMDVRKAFEFEKIAGAVKEVLVPYVAGYCLTAFLVYVAFKFHSIPYLLGLALWSVLTFYVLLVATYFFTQLFRKTTLSAGRIP